VALRQAVPRLRHRRRPQLCTAHTKHMHHITRVALLHC
jgi:hypothetical protein